MNNSVDVVIIGAGVIGLATGRELARKGVDTLILDGEPVFGSWTSSRNSEVIHAGLYYESQSLKARTCVRGRDLLYAFCNARGVPHRQCGKLVVAVNDAQVQELEQLSRLAHANGADSRLIDIQELRRLEPAVRAAGALFSPNTGIIDSHAYMQALLGEAETYGARLVCRTQVTRIRQSGQGWNVSIAGETEPVVHASWVINSAGLFAQNVSRTVEGMSEQHIPRLRLAKGSYCTYAGRTPFGRLIYPLPEHGGLGVHLTFDMGGQARFGPDVKWVD
ncbi:MAG: NAD(P)/FAD-dependent oxidoreductase, partial [Chloroflexota bacterium]